MYNQVTDRFRLVQTEIVRAVPVVGRTLSAIEGYSLEIFWGEIHRGSVRTHRDESASNTERESVKKMKVHKGDVIYKVNVAHQPIPVVGSLMTKDRYIRIYDITIDLVVSDPVLFIQGYRLGKDPVNVAIERFRSSIQGYASRTEHDKLVSLNRLGDAWNNTLRADTGIMITQISKWELWKDSKREEAFRIQQEAENKRKSITARDEIQKLEDRFERERDALKREHARSEQRKQNEFEGEEETQRHMHRLHMRLRETAAQEFTDILRERIRFAFESNRSISEVAEDSLKLLNAFHESLRRGSVVDSALSSGPSTSTDGASSEEETTIEHDPSTDQLFYMPPHATDLSGTVQKEAGKE